LQPAQWQQLLANWSVVHGFAHLALAGHLGPVKDAASRDTMLRGLVAPMLHQVVQGMVRASAAGTTETAAAATTTRAEAQRTVPSRRKRTS
jgi:hypothetical protein